MPVRLQALLKSLPAEMWETPPPGDDIEIEGLSLDSRCARSGELFFALPGQRTEGGRYVEEAWMRGVAAVLIEGGAVVPEGAGPLLRVRHARQALGLIAARYYQEPSRALRLIGITGTDGKTSTCWFVQHLLAAAGRRCVALGTLGIKMEDGSRQPWPEREAPGSGASLEPARTWQPTTPEAPLFQATLAQLRDSGVEDVVAEISSHALSQERAFGSQFAAVALTQVSADHLDFHGTRADYLAAKARLFDRATRGGVLERNPVREVLNLDDELGCSLAASRGAECVTYGRAAQAQVRLLSGKADARGILMEIDFAGESRVVSTKLLGRFHLQNLLAAAAITYALGLSPEEIAAGLSSVTPVPGRFEQIPTDLPVSVIVDYAHTPEALESLLLAARQLGSGRLTLVFGCGGDRDPAKREPMGAIAGSLADRVIVTSDNPRAEDPAGIAAAILRGVSRGAAEHEEIPDRRAALEQALAGARHGEILVVAGRGAETLQVFADRVERFDDREILRRLLREQSILRSVPGEGEDPWSLGAVAKMTHAIVAGVSPEDWRLVSALPAVGVSLDSRQVTGGEVFVALPGERFDGHSFIPAAFEAGACAALARRGWWSRRKAARAKGIHFLVDDPVIAMQDWATAIRAAVAPKVIAITGSSGKTTTKELLLALLRGRGGVVGTIGNRNNEIGLPWTLLQLRSGDQWAVVELGANHPGEIGRLAEICRPDVALITCIGRAHVGRFGGIDALREAKLEILQGLAADGVLVIPDDDELLAERVGERWAGRTLRFGFGEGADIRGAAVQVSLQGSELSLPNEARPVRLRMLGRAGARAALAALAGFRALGLTDPDLDRLMEMAPFPGRLDPISANGITWLLDVYNASPESVLSALQFLAEVKTSGRKVFVFGGMHELGEQSEAIHQEIGRAAGFCDAGVFLGQEARISAPQAQKAGMMQVLWCEQIEEVVRFLRDYLRRGDLVLLKGARSAALERVAEAMQVIDATYGAGGF